MSFLISLTLGGNLFIRATCFFYQIAICKISHQIISRELLNCTHGTLPAAEHATFLAACLSQGSSSGWADERSFGLCGPHLCFKAMGQIGHNILQIYGWPTMLRIWQNYNGSTYNNSEIQTHPNSRQSDAKHVCRSSSRKMLTKKNKSQEYYGNVHNSTISRCQEKLSKTDQNHSAYSSTISTGNFSFSLK